MNSERTELFHQVRRARESLGDALGKTQDIKQEGFDVSAVNETLAGAVKALFTAESTGLRDPAPILESMDHLRLTLTRMQDVRGEDPGLTAATATVAKTLAILFPVHKALEKETTGEDQPILLTQAKSEPEPEDEPVPLPLMNKRTGDNEPVDVEERRDNRRRQIEVDIGIQSETNFYTGFSMDISSGGLFVATYDIPPVGTEVNVNFAIPGGPMMSLGGKVRWVREYNEISPETAPGMGVMFENLSEEEQVAINEYIAKRSPMFFE